MKKATFFAYACALAALVSAACSFEGMAEPQARSASAIVADDEVTQVRDEANRLRLHGVLFAIQLGTLIRGGVPEEIVAALRAQRAEVLATAAELAIPQERALFLPVIPLSVMDATRQIRTVEHYGKRGVNEYLTGAIRDVIDFTESAPYYIFDVEDGTETRGEPPAIAGTSSWAEGKERRRGLTLAETIALVRHRRAAVLGRHAVWAVGSRYETNRQVPLVHLNGKGQPALDWGNVGYYDEYIGAPSCGMC